MTKKRSQVEWEQDLNRWKASGKSLVIFCKESGLSPSTLRYWSAKLKKPEPDQKLVAISTSMNSIKQENAGGITLSINPRITVTFPLGISPHFLAAFVRDLIR